MHLPSDTLHYIISFLLCTDCAEESSLIAYTSDPTEYRGYPLAIIPADITPRLSYLDTLPIFHGTPSVTRDRDTIVLHADLIATTFYLLSRYDEHTSEAPLDIHSRFRPENSLLGANGLLQTPVLDLYTEFIYRLLNRPKPHRHSHIYLTHDIDTITNYRRPRGFLGALARTLLGKNPDPLSAIFKSLKSLENDPVYTFPLLQRLDAELPVAEVLYFAKPDVRYFAPLDRPLYSHKSADFRTLTHLHIGLHSLYYTYDHHETLNQQFATIVRLPNNNTYHRSHYLRVLPPTQMHLYVEAGITDDFTMGYASIPGFRLGTTRPSQAINPATKELLPLTMHPLTIMDTTLSDTRYLHLSEHEAYELAKSLIDTTFRYEGDIDLLFHNSSFRPSSYHENLYKAILSHIKHHQHL